MLLWGGLVFSMWRHTLHGAFSLEHVMLMCTGQVLCLLQMLGMSGNASLVYRGSAQSMPCGTFLAATLCAAYGESSHGSRMHKHYLDNAGRVFLSCVPFGLNLRKTLPALSVWHVYACIKHTCVMVNVSRWLKQSLQQIIVY